MTTERKPVIGVVTGRRDENGELFVNPNIQMAVEELGGEVLAFNYDRLQLFELMDEVKKIDGFIFPGGGDLEPDLYGRTRLPECGTPVPAWDELEINLFPLLMDRMLPMLGICRGCQTINVGFGGTLIQDLPSQKNVQHRQGDSVRYFHKVRLLPDTLIRAAIGKEELMTNSFHHQAVDDIAPGLKISACSEDGIVEAIENAASAPFILGVQWHPEITRDDPESRAVFECFMAAVNKRLSIMNAHKNKEED